MTTINTIKYLAVMFITSAFVIHAQSKYMYSNENLLEKLSHNYAENEFISEIIEIADSYLDKDVRPLTSVVSPMGKNHLHDYFSEGPYWWPNPEDPNGPYIRKDGKRNPERFNEHKELMISMYQSLSSLAIAAYFSQDEMYIKKIENIIDDWFIKSETKMAPHLKYAQMIRNKDVVRGVGIIETHRFVRLMEVMILLKQSKLVSDDRMDGFDLWLNDYYDWLTKSRWGIDEKYRGNNHSSWWAAQAAAIAIYLDRDEDLFEFYEYGKSYLIDRQINKDCRQPLEDKRTLSLDYNTFNLNALCYLASAMLTKDYNLFKYKPKEGGTLLCAADYINQFVVDPDKWQLTQIKEFKVQPQEYIAVIGLKLNNRKFIELQKALLDYKQTNSKELYLDPFVLLLDAQISVSN